MEEEKAKRTGKDIYAFVNKKLEEAKARKSSEEIISDKAIYGLDKKIEAYEEVLNFISKEPEIVGSTTIDEAFEKFVLDTWPEIKKKLKALEIVKEKAVDLGTLLYYVRNLNHALAFYNKGIANEKKKLTQDEFALLKEVMK